MTDLRENKKFYFPLFFLLTYTHNVCNIIDIRNADYHRKENNMTILRPNEYSVDNEINMEMRDILERYLKKNNKEIETLEIYGVSVIATTTDGEQFQMNKAEGCKAGTSYLQKNFFYMTQIVNGKKARVKKEKW